MDSKHIKVDKNQEIEKYHLICFLYVSHKGTLPSSASFYQSTSHMIFFPSNFVLRGSYIFHRVPLGTTPLRMMSPSGA